jgi:hypothetical protein
LIRIEHHKEIGCQSQRHVQCQNNQGSFTYRALVKKLNKPQKKTVILKGNSLSLMARTVPIRLYRPDFPGHNLMSMHSRIANGDTRQSNWETTYRASMRPQTQMESRSSIDTTSLQRTHWTVGDLPPGDVSEHKADFRDFGPNHQSTPNRTREDMMQTSFRLGDNSTIPPRAASRTCYTAVQRPSFGDKMVGTHFDLTNPSELKVPWQSTHTHDFQDPKAAPPPPATTDLSLGLGAKATFEQLGAHPTKTSLMHDSFRPYTQQAVRAPPVTVSGTAVNFEQGNSQLWRQTNFKVGDNEKRYTTTTGDGLQPPGPVDRPDPSVARDRKQALSKSYAGQGHHFPTVTETTTRAAVQPHPEARALPLGERTAFVSHHDYRNYNGPISTTVRDSFVPKQAESVHRTTGNLQESHASFGREGERMGTTLYRESFVKLPPIGERANVTERRDFHQAHHNDARAGPAERLETTTYRTAFTGCPGGRASDLCDGLRGGNNVVASEPSFTVRRSAMKEDFIPHRGVQRPPPVDNFLQRSHIQLQGNPAHWTTTQQDYFLWQQYRMPGHPF